MASYQQRHSALEALEATDKPKLREVISSCGIQAHIEPNHNLPSLIKRVLEIADRSEPAANRLDRDLGLPTESERAIEMDEAAVRAQNRIADAATEAAAQARRSADAAASSNAGARTAAILAWIGAAAAVGSAAIAAFDLLKK